MRDELMMSRLYVCACRCVPAHLNPPFLFALSRVLMIIFQNALSPSCRDEHYKLSSLKEKKRNGIGADYFIGRYFIVMNYGSRDFYRKYLRDSPLQANYIF